MPRKDMPQFRFWLPFIIGIAGLAAACLYLWQDNPAGPVKPPPAIIRIATKPMTEQFILSEMLAILIHEKAGLETAITKGIGGGTANIHPALVRGDFDLYPEYTGTAWSYVLKKEGIPEEKALQNELRREYSSQFGLEWVGLYGFNNTYGLALRKPIAERNDIRTFSDLAAIAGNLIFGAEYDFYEREDGFTALCQAYGYTFKQHVDLDIGLKYPAIASGRIDVMNVFTTDGQLAAADIRLLEDDKHFYQTYYCGTVARSDILRKHPELRRALMLMDGLIGEAEMAAMNYQVETEKREDRVVAREFLRMKELID